MNTDLLAGGRYRVVRRLAQGGMGEVLLAEFGGDTTLGVSKGYVVLKRVLSSAHNRDHQRAMLREEARISLRLLHENLVESFFLDEHEGDPILVMEFLGGRSYAQVLGLAKKSRAMVPIDVTLALMRASACGLYFAHSLTDRGRPLGLVHRDISPANLFVTFDGRVKVIDFGVAKSDDSELRTSTGVLKGKLGYMSPEHAAGDIKLNAASDLWSLGVLMWESLCAERLFASPAPSETIDAIVRRPIPLPTQHRPEVPKAVVDICMGLLERDVDRRIASGAELVQRIDALMLGDTLRNVDLGAFLAERFPNEIVMGREEAARAARMRRRVPVSVGLVEGLAVAAPEEGEMPTVVLSAAFQDALRSRVAVGDITYDSNRDPTLDTQREQTSTTSPVRIDGAQAQGLFNGASGNTFKPPPATGVTSPEKPAPRNLLVEPDVPLLDASELEEVDINTRTQRIADLPPLGQPLDTLKREVSGVRAGSDGADARASKLPTKARDTISLREVPLFAVALMTFGVLACGMGLVFARVAPPAIATSVFAFVDGQRTIVVGLAKDVPAGLVPRPVTLSAPALPGAAIMSAADSEAFRTRLQQSGVIARARLPASRRAEIASALPSFIIVLGLLALAIGVPTLLVRRPSMMRFLQVGLLIAVVALGVKWARQGALGWPGLSAYRDVPRLDVTQPKAPAK